VSHTPDLASEERAIRLSLNVALRLAVVALLAVFSFVILKPFMIVLLWAVILAVALKSPFEWLAGKLGKRGLAGTVFALVAIGVVMVPSYSIVGSLVETAQSMRSSLDEGTLQAPPPPESLENIPAVGQRVYDAWMLASVNAQEAVTRYEPQLRSAGSWLLGFLAGVGGTVLTTVLALIIAAVFLTYSETLGAGVRAVMGRIQGDWDEDMVGMASATINSVAVGVLGVATIQALIAGTGMFIAGFPLAGIWTIVMLVLAIVQMPGIIPMAVPLVWGFGNLSPLWAVLFAIFCVVAGFVDAPLKAIFLGRGVPVPTAIILLGAIGGMAGMGMMGLFLGAIILGITWRLSVLWVTGSHGEATVDAEVAGA